jgi:hypothetical protein
MFWSNPFLAGVVVGAIGLGVPLSIVTWTDGYVSAMRSVSSWLRPEQGEVHGDVPNLPPARERRYIATTPGRWI